MIGANAIFLFINVAMAWYHARTFPVKHGIWAAYYLAAAYVSTWLFTRSTILHFAPFSVDWIPLVFFLVLVVQRKPAFDLPLNYFRKKPRWYVSTSTGSILDRFFYWLFKPTTEIKVKRMYGAFTLLWAVLIILYYLLNG